MRDNPIKVMIADDEAIIRKGLMSTVRWDRYNMAVVADVPNGARGWEAFLEQRPDVIITDIVMPEMNGIELAQKVKTVSPDTKILLLSCHRDFEYAQMGIKLGASGYLLKTSYDDSELEEFLDKFEKEISSRGHTDAARDADNRTELAPSFTEWLYGLNDRFLVLKAALEEGGWAWMRQGRSFAYLVTAESEAGDMNALSQRLIAGTTVPDGALLAAGDDRLFLFCPEESRKEWECRLIELKGAYRSVRWTKSGPLDGGSRWNEAIRKLHQQFEIGKQYQVNVDHWPEQITKAVELMVRSVDTPLSVTDVAHEVGLSRSHFSTMFKKIVGESFVSFTYRIKLKIACELLRSTTVTQQQIADKIGMPDVKYFSKWFKRCTSETPSQYRLKHR